MLIRLLSFVNFQSSEKVDVDLLTVFVEEQLFRGSYSTIPSGRKWDGDWIASRTTKWVLAIAICCHSTGFILYLEATPTTLNCLKEGSLNEGNPLMLLIYQHGQLLGEWWRKKCPRGQQAPIFISSLSWRESMLFSCYYVDNIWLGS